MTSRLEAPPPGRSRPGMALIVLGLHALLVAVLWRTLHDRVVDVSHERAPLVLVQVVQPPPGPVLAPEIPAIPAIVPHRPAVPPRPVQPSPALTTMPHESTWVEAAPAQVVAEPAPAASSAPAERLMDSAATRAAIRQTGRQALLHERAAEATGQPIERTDTALARAVAEAGKADCLKDPKAASGQVGPIAVGGILGLPFLAARIVSGNCAK